VTTVKGLPGLTIAGPGQGRNPAAAAGQPVKTLAEPPADQPAGVFTRFALELAALHPDRAITVLQAGCTTAGLELDLAALRAKRPDTEVCLVDDDQQASRAVVASRADLAGAALGELRLVPLRPRSFDIVHCSMLLHRISNAELVASRLVAALRPGGLLLLQVADRDSAGGFLDRRLPRAVRRLLWRRARPAEPGPYPAIYEPISSARGMEAFLARHGLAVAHRQALNTPDSAARPGAVAAARRLVSWASHGRLGPGHDELHYVIRKPEDSFARLLP
jgi:SAM-dependent methyltransferase